MPASIAGWRRNEAARLEWDHLHRGKMLPVGALPVWVGVGLFTLAMTFRWGLLPMPVLTPEGAEWLRGSSWALPTFTLSHTPAHWLHAAVFWALPWALMERRLQDSPTTWKSLESKATVLIRLFGWALLFYPLLRIGIWGITRLWYRGPVPPTMVDIVLFDETLTLAPRYFLSLTVTGLWAASTWMIVVSRLRVAQWAAAAQPKRPLARLMLYCMPTLAMALLLVVIFEGVFQPLADQALNGDLSSINVLLHRALPWALVVTLFSLLVAVWARTEARRLMKRRESSSQAR